MIQISNSINSNEVEVLNCNDWLQQARLMNLYLGKNQSISMYVTHFTVHMYYRVSQKKLGLRIFRKDWTIFFKTVFEF